MGVWCFHVPRKYGDAMFRRTQKIWASCVFTFPENMGMRCWHVPRNCGGVFFARTVPRKHGRRVRCPRIKHKKRILETGKCLPRNHRYYSSPYHEVLSFSYYLHSPNSRGQWIFTWFDETPHFFTAAFGPFCSLVSRKRTRSDRAQWRRLDITRRRVSSFLPTSGYLHLYHGGGRRRE